MAISEPAPPRRVSGELPSLVAATTICLLTGWILSGCYRYTEAERRTIDAGTEVVLALTTGRVEGRVLAIADTSITLRTARPARERFRAGGTAVDTVEVLSSRVESIERREVSTGKTAALVGGIAVAAGLASAVLFGAVSGSGGAEDSGNDVRRVLLAPRR